MSALSEMTPEELVDRVRDHAGKQYDAELLRREHAMTEHAKDILVDTAKEETDEEHWCRYTARDILSAASESEAK